MDNFSVLPEGCISQILSMTSPRDACRSSAISSGFDAAANSDPVWEKFLPSDYRQIISRSVSPVVFSTKKQLYFSLCDSPLLLDGGKLSFALDRESGKKCYTLPAREVAIAWKEDSRYWKWISLPESRFPEVAQLLHVWWLDIWGRISTAMLSPNTTYTAYLIFKITDQRHSKLESLPLKASVRFVNGEDGYEDDNSSTVFLTLRTLRSVGGGQNGRLPQTRKDGWMEIELGEFYNDVAADGEVEMRLREVKSMKTGLIVEGIESFALDRESRKKCYTLPARELEIAWKDDSRYWKWISLPDSRFSEVAQLLYVWWLDIWGRINTAMLSANTTYAAYLIFKAADHYDFESLPVKSSVRFVKELEDGYQDDMSRTAFLTLETLRSLPRKQNGRLPQMRRDGWMEIELGTFTTTMEMRVKWR